MRRTNRNKSQSKESLKVRNSFLLWSNNYYQSAYIWIIYLFIILQIVPTHEEESTAFHTTHSETTRNLSPNSVVSMTEVYLKQLQYTLLIHSLFSFR